MILTPAEVEQFKGAATGLKASLAGLFAALPTSDETRVAENALLVSTKLTAVQQWLDLLDRAMSPPATY